MLPIASGMVTFSLLLLLLPRDSAVGSPQKHQDPPSPSASCHSSWSLGLRLYRALRVGNHDALRTNVLFSPLTLAATLDALGEGSKGATARQIQDLLKGSSQMGAAAEAAPGLQQALKSMLEANNTAYSLHSASALFSKQASGLDQGFLKKAESSSGLTHVVLSSAGREQSDSDVLQAWARGASGGANLAQMSTEPPAQSATLMLASTLRFKGLWDRAFEESNEDLRNFLGVKYTRVPMMHRSGWYGHYEDVENMVQVLELGLWGGQVSMLLLLPFHVEGLERLDKLLSLERLQAWQGKLSPTSMALSLPRVNLTSALNLQTALSSLGLVDAWDQGKADFTGLGGAEGQPLHLGGVLQWASLELASHSGQKEEDMEEEDVEVKKPKIFYADHSFVVMVTDKTTGALLLIGAMDLAEGRSLHDEL